jgi:hypothetical protein
MGISLSDLPVLSETERSCLGRYLVVLSESLGEAATRAQLDRATDDRTATFLANVERDGICLYRRRSGEE